MNSKTLILVVTFLSFFFHITATQPVKNAQEQGREKLLMCMAGEWIAHSLYVAVELNIADLLQAGPKSADDLASQSQANAEAVNRIMRLLTSMGIFEEVQEGVYANNETSLLLTKKHPFTLHDTIRYYEQIAHPVFDELLDCTHKGIPAFDLKYNKPVFQHFKEHPHSLALFQAAMREKSKAVIHSSIKNYDFNSLKSVYDIGGGYGHFIVALLKQYPQMQGMLYELPEVIKEVPQKNPDAVNPRLSLVSGNFFEMVPKGGDAYLLKSVFHDWDDEKVELILQNLHTAMPDNGRLLIVEYIMMPKGEVYAKCMDILMLAMIGGKERSLANYEALFEKTGFKIKAVYPTGTEFSIIEVNKQ